jgi:uncharacterized protein (TIGR02328 family)
MRLWHKDLIPVLPKKHLLAQWRECCCIARNITVNGTPNHLLVNKILTYPDSHFHRYAQEIAYEMQHRGYKCDINRFSHFTENGVRFIDMPSHVELFKHWHNDRYLRQCYYNLQEKYDCGGIPEDEWQKVHTFVTSKINLQ